ncbi:MAG: hypothetical protein NC211_01425 [Alistipes senegalensis]|nr:hypothetical protein [Oxalobacter formigenes]MCM1280485.1 hypothetical protein [Alistipes senegalensis]
MQNKKILVISEGEKTEPLIYGDHLVKAGLLPDDVSVFSYKASLHDLIQLFENTKNLDFADFKGTLIEKERKKNTKDSAEQIKRLQEKYTDTILVFDLDPQDKERYDSRKIINLLRVFDESSDNGKLYLSYPMIEALFDARDSASFPFGKKGEYKEQIKNKKNNLYRLFRNDELTFKYYQAILRNQFDKAGKITPYHENDFHLNLFKKQDAAIANGKIYIISTALFFLIDYWGKKVMQVNSSEEL